MPALLYYQLEEEKKEIPCRDVMTIGRDPTNDIVLADPKVSRRHAMVCRLNIDNFYLVDEGSSNGSFINAKRATLPTLLQDGDRISVGGVNLLFRQPTSEPVNIEPQKEAGATTVVITPTVEIIKTTILVADIRGFTRLSESLPVQKLTELMNEWFQATTRCIKERLGVIDKFLGDSVYARWETGEDILESLRAAIDAACELNRISRNLNERFHGIPQELKIGAAINFGIAALGTDQGRTAIGDAVNLTFRLEEQSKVLGKDLLISKDAYEHLPAEFWVGHEHNIRVDGKAAPVDVWGLSFDDAAAVLEKI